MNCDEDNNVPTSSTKHAIPSAKSDRDYNNNKRTATAGYFFNPSKL